MKKSILCSFFNIGLRKRIFPFQSVQRASQSKKIPFFFFLFSYCNYKAFKNVEHDDGSIPEKIKYLTKKIEDQLELINDAFENLNPDSYDSIALLIGNTKSGKTTIANMISGVKLHIKELNGLYVVERKDGQNPFQMKIGHEISKSTTKGMFPFQGKNDLSKTLIIDLPGFLDTNLDHRVEHKFLMMNLINRLIKMQKPVSFLWVIDEADILGTGSSHLKYAFETIYSFFQPDMMEKMQKEEKQKPYISIIINKCSHDNQKKENNYRIDIGEIFLEKSQNKQNIGKLFDIVPIAMIKKAKPRRLWYSLWLIKNYDYIHSEKTCKDISDCLLKTGSIIDDENMMKKVILREDETTLVNQVYNELLQHIQEKFKKPLESQKKELEKMTKTEFKKFFVDFLSKFVSENDSNDKDISTKELKKKIDKLIEFTRENKETIMNVIYQYSNLFQNIKVEDHKGKKTDYDVTELLSREIQNYFINVIKLMSLKAQQLGEYKTLQKLSEVEENIANNPDLSEKYVNMALESKNERTFWQTAIDKISDMFDVGNKGIKFATGFLSLIALGY